MMGRTNGQPSRVSKEKATAEACAAPTASAVCGAAHAKHGDASSRREQGQHAGSTPEQVRQLSRAADQHATCLAQSDSPQVP